MTFIMKGFSGFGDKDKRILRRANRNLIKEQRELYRQGIITKDQFKSARQEIKNYTDVDAAKDYLFDKGLKPYNEPVRRSDKK
tara:strand:- start:505 stop:753 length:249 start_codon:yes stop_codon:yes gene_type:complete